MKKPKHTWLTTALLTITALLAPPTHAFATDEPLRYVALGDSYAAAPLVRPLDPSDVGCLRSLANYPHVTAQLLGADLTDVTCSGATADDFTGSELGTPPQFEALTADTDLVTVTIGANDAELFRLPRACVNTLPPPFGTSCAATSILWGTDRYARAIDAWAPTFDDTLRTIRAEAPHAKIVVVGYGTYLRPGGCFPSQPYWSQDADYIQARIGQLNGVLSSAAARHGAHYVDTAAISTGHDACAPAADRHIQSALSLADGAPLHPTSAGSAAFARAIASVVADG
ncbi:SGNH/GDSL hydrolase family protein [Streptomyces sp. NPDC055051]